MKITELIRTRGKSLSFEFFPPMTPIGEDRLLDRISILKTYCPTFISVTQHAGPNTLDRTRHLAGILQGDSSITVMPHITCADPVKTDLAAVLKYYRDLGTENILAVRGDPEEYGPGLFDGVTRYRYASELVKFIAGHDSFCIGVGVYPEGHPQSANLGIDTSNTKKKVDEGAGFAISQMFFENYYYYEMLERFTQNSINIPVIAGIMPITDFQKIEQLAELGGVEIPIPVTARFEEFDDPDDVLKAGIDFATRQCLDLWENGVRCFHFYTLNRHEAVTAILENLASTFNQ